MRGLSFYDACRMLVIAQVVLALQLPFTIVPLIKATSEPQLMGQFASPPIVQLLSWGATTLIFLGNLMFLISMLLWPQGEGHNGSYGPGKLLHSLSTVSYADLTKRRFSIPPSKALKIACIGSFSIVHPFA